MKKHPLHLFALTIILTLGCAALSDPQQADSVSTDVSSGRPETDFPAQQERQSTDPSIEIYRMRMVQETSSDGWTYYEVTLGFKNNSSTSAVMGIEGADPGNPWGVGNVKVHTTESYVEATDGNTYDATITFSDKYFPNQIRAFLPYGLPTSGKAYDPWVARFRVPETLTPASLIITPGASQNSSEFTQIKVDLSNDTDILSVIDASIYESLPLTFEITDNLTLEFGAAQKGQGRQQSIAIFIPYTITNKDLTGDQAWGSFETTTILIDRFGLKNEVSPFKSECTAQVPSTVGPGQTVEGLLCFELSDADAYSNILFLMLASNTIDKIFTVNVLE
jgi:hypothetical protein